MPVYIRYRDIHRIFWFSVTYLHASLCDASCSSCAFSSSSSVVLCVSFKTFSYSCDILWKIVRYLRFFTSMSLLQFSSVQFSHSVMSDSLQRHESQHARPPCASPTPRVYPNSCPLSRWCHPTISSSLVPFSCLQSFPASGSFQMSHLFALSGQSTGVSALASFLPKKSQGWSPSEWTGWISLQSRGLSRVFSNTTVQKHQFFGTQLSSQSNSYIHTWPLEK